MPYRLTRRSLALSTAALALPRFAQAQSGPIRIGMVSPTTGPAARLYTITSGSVVVPVAPSSSLTVITGRKMPAAV